MVSAVLDFLDGKAHEPGREKAMRCCDACGREFSSLKKVCTYCGYNMRRGQNPYDDEIIRGKEKRAAKDGAERAEADELAEYGRTREDQE